MRKMVLSPTRLKWLMVADVSRHQDPIKLRFSEDDTCDIEETSILRTDN